MVSMMGNFTRKQQHMLDTLVPRKWYGETIRFSACRIGPGIISLMAWNSSGDWSYTFQYPLDECLDKTLTHFLEMARTSLNEYMDAVLDWYGLRLNGIKI